MSRTLWVIHRRKSSIRLGRFDRRRGYSPGTKIAKAGEQRHAVPYLNHLFVFIIFHLTSDEQILGPSAVAATTMFVIKGTFENRAILIRRGRWCWRVGWLVRCLLVRFLSLVPADLIARRARPTEQIRPLIAHGILIHFVDIQAADDRRAFPIF